MMKGLSDSICVLLCIFAFSDGMYFGKLNKTAFLQVIKNSPKKLNFVLPTPRTKIRRDSVFLRLQGAYNNFQQKYYSEARSFSESILEGMSEAQDSCSTCKGNAVGKERTQCYASCMTRELETFSSHALLIGETVQNFFCQPLGFGFDKLFNDKKSTVFRSFEQFQKRFNEDNETALSSLVESWMANILWLEKTPLYLHSFIRSNLALDIEESQSVVTFDLKPDQIIGAGAATTSTTPEQFATKCGSTFDLSAPVYSLINAAQDKSHFLDIILRGYFSAKSAAFYTLGEYHNLAGGIIEALGALIGVKCNIIAYSEGGDVSEEFCDGFGKYPIPQFPVPSIFTKLLLPCEENSSPLTKLANKLPSLSKKIKNMFTKDIKMVMD